MLSMSHAIDEDEKQDSLLGMYNQNLWPYLLCLSVSTSDILPCLKEPDD